MNNLVDIEYENLDDILSEKDIAIVYFWSPGCGICRYTSPLYESLSKEYPNVLFGKVNTRENQETYNMLGIKGVPAVKFYEQGMTVDTIVGCKDPMTIKQVYKDRIEELVNG